jgi:hypothetical protein
VILSLRLISKRLRNKSSGSSISSFVSSSSGQWSGLLDSASDKIILFPGKCCNLISNSNRNSDHLVCQSDSFCASQKQVRFL